MGWIRANGIHRFNAYKKTEPDCGPGRGNSTENGLVPYPKSCSRYCQVQSILLLNTLCS